MNSNVLNKFRNKSTQSWQPLQVSLELTNRCNERCQHCYIDDFVDDEKRLLSQEQWFETLAQLREGGALYLILMGGEPMLSPVFWPVLQEAVRLGFHTSMITNGQLIRDKETVIRLKHTGLHAVTFSFYSLNEKTHDFLTRVRGSQKRTQAAIEMCKDLGLEVFVNCLLTNANISEVFDLEDWCVARGIDLKVDPIITATLGGSKRPTELRATAEQLHWFYHKKARKWKGGGPTPYALSAEDYVCNAGKGKCAITAYGEVLPCIEIREPMGSLTEMPFTAIWQNSVADRWRKLKNKDIKSSGNYSFCDHCPGMAKNETGNGDKVLPFTQLVANIKAEVYKTLRDERRDFEHGLPPA